MSDSLHYIDRYFLGELSPDEKKAFEGRCLYDHSFARMVAFYVSLHDHLQQEWAERKKEEFALLEISDSTADVANEHKVAKMPLNENYGERIELPPAEKGVEEREHVVSKPENVAGKVRSMSTLGRLSVAAVVLVVIALGVILFIQTRNKTAPVATHNKKSENITNSSTSPDMTPVPQTEVVKNTDSQVEKQQETAQKKKEKIQPQQLFAQHFTLDNPPHDKNEILDEAFEQYKSGNYKAASGKYEETLVLVESVTGRSTENKEAQKEKEQIVFYAHYYNALSYLAEGNASKAINELRAIRVSPDNYWRSKQQWYMALAYLKMGELKNAEALLKQVTENKQGKDYRQKAIKLTSELNNSHPPE